jgi:hypothetical protein
MRVRRTTHEFLHCYMLTHFPSKLICRALKQQLTPRTKEEQCEFDLPVGLEVKVVLIVRRVQLAHVPLIFSMTILHSPRWGSGELPQGAASGVGAARAAASNASGFLHIA